MLYYALALALGLIYWAHWSYVTVKRVKTLSSDVESLQMVLERKTKKSKEQEDELAKSLSQKKEMERIILDYDRASTGFVEWTKENAFFKDANGAKEMYELWEESVVFLGREYKNLL